MGKTIKSLRRNPDAPLWRDVLKSIKAKPKLAFYFAKPVDHVALNIPLYPTIVKIPMDLQTIERKLAANEYAELDDFATDVRLVFSNAMLFNKNEQHQVHIAARKLSTFFELKYEELKRGHQREKRDAPGRRDRPPPRPHGAFASQPRAAFLQPATTRGASRQQKRKQEVPEGMVPASVVEKLRADMELMRKEVERLKRQNSSVEVSEPSSTDDSDESSNDGSLKPRRPLAKLRFRVSSRDDGIATSHSTDTLGTVSVATSPLGTYDPDASLDGLDADDVARLRSAMVEIGDDDEVTRLSRTPPDAPPPKKHRYSMSPAALDLPRPDTLRSGSEYSLDPLPQAGSTSPLWAFPEEELPAE